MEEEEEEEEKEAVDRKEVCPLIIVKPEINKMRV